MEADERAEHAARAEAGDGERCVTVSGGGMLFFFFCSALKGAINGESCGAGRQVGR